MGFGAGMGLPNIKQCSDELNIDSKVGVGTKLHAKVYLNKKPPFVN
jgi:anti-sigma regulatory factor (Ser/Thr protein kinase)